MKIEKQLYEKQGIALQITNNRRKSLLKSDIIINMDYTQEELNHCNFPKKAIIINIKHKAKIQAKDFVGLNINDYKIKKSEENHVNIPEQLLGSFSESSLYESIIYENYFKIEAEIWKYIQIDYLIGNNGKIQKNEFKLT